MSHLLAIACALPWVATPVVTLVRARHSRSLGEESAAAPDDAPLVSVVIPARNEARNIERCVRSALAADYPRLEVIAVDDHSSDATGEILARLAASDARLRVVAPPPLPAGWFGKQWACNAGFLATRGDVIGFVDADTALAPDLVPRIVNGMRTRDADFLTVLGDQEMGTFWERLVQPQVFAIMMARYGGTEVVNESPRVADKIANGQCIFVTRDEYVAIGGHGAVRDKVAEDLSLAQLYFSAGRRAFVVLGLDQLSTRMYTSLRELVEGWGKNLYASGRDTVPFGRVGRFLYPAMLLLPSLSGLVPPVLLALSLLGMFGPSVLLWSAVVSAANLAWWLLVYARLGMSPLYAFLHPLGAAALLYISARAIVRGRNVRWKERDYVVT